jgi:hypothetical protein
MTALRPEKNPSGLGLGDIDSLENPSKLFFFLDLREKGGPRILSNQVDF